MTPAGRARASRRDVVAAATRGRHESVDLPANDLRVVGPCRSRLGGSFFGAAAAGGDSGRRTFLPRRIRGFVGRAEQPHSAPRASAPSDSAFRPARSARLSAVLAFFTGARCAAPCRAFVASADFVTSEAAAGRSAFAAATEHGRCHDGTRRFRLPPTGATATGGGAGRGALQPTARLCRRRCCNRRAQLWPPAPANSRALLQPTALRAAARCCDGDAVLLGGGRCCDGGRRFRFHHWRRRWRRCGRRYFCFSGRRDRIDRLRCGDDRHRRAPPRPGAARA